ncbi:hypothetical protein CRUP_022124 [Coryphaenoides rupestris]|nr:hypothetical protein CRUP_022124 [Coryphaenoides rupestris]
MQKTLSWMVVDGLALQQSDSVDHQAPSRRTRIHQSEKPQEHHQQVERKLQRLWIPRQHQHQRPEDDSGQTAGSQWTVLLRLFVSHIHINGQQARLALQFLREPANIFLETPRFNRLAHTKENMAKDGINSLHYKVVSQERRPLYTYITVDVGKP